MNTLTVIFWLIAITTTYHSNVSYSSARYYNEETCEVEAKRLSTENSKHLNAKCEMRCEGKNCGKAILEYKFKKMGELNKIILK